MSLQVIQSNPGLMGAGDIADPPVANEQLGVRSGTAARNPAEQAGQTALMQHRPAHRFLF
jgi:hypothetical protein